MPHQHTNSLIHSSSPYLLQHAHNPVHWYPWGGEALEKAKKENKMMLVSIGYSACHWCHVMEHESFEDEDVARLMNEHFICIKVDREERPDIDQVYMNAVQLMSGRGGWPLNCFTLPDGRPVYGGTYFPKQAWLNILSSLANVYNNEKEKAYEYAERLTQGIQANELVNDEKEIPAFSMQVLRETVQNWSRRFDNTEGGPDKAPKFPLPNNYQFLLRYACSTKNENLLSHVKLTLKKMAYGGIYDQIGGGFARYSTDSLWKVPHFEKMLYDNAQLVSLYSEAYWALKDPLYKEIVYETLEFIRRELTSPEGAFYCALDADSEGEEGKYYVWKDEELQETLDENYKLAREYYEIKEEEEWEHSNYILLRKKDDSEIAQLLGMNEQEVKSKIFSVKKILLEKREKRIKPGLDDKCLTSWNALMIKAYADAYKVFEEKSFLLAAEKNAALLLTKLRSPDGGLYHGYKNGKAGINGFLEDYAFLTEGLITLYEVTFEEKWLFAAKELADYVFNHFIDKNSPHFYFTSDKDAPLIARKKELTDNVIPASNSAMAKSIFYLGHFFSDTLYMEYARRMLEQVMPFIPPYGAGYSNWAMLAINVLLPFHEVVIVGKDVDKIHRELCKNYLTNLNFAGSVSGGSIPLLKNRYKEGKTWIYICVNNACKAPVESSEEALKLMEKG